MTELPGGATVTIVRGSENLHTFVRTRPGPGASWIFATPMSARQRRTLPPEPEVDVSKLSLEDRMRHGGDVIERRRRRAHQVNDRVRDFNSDADPVYRLGYGIHSVVKELLWKIFDGVASERGAGATIEVEDLNRWITYRRGDNRPK